MASKVYLKIIQKKNPKSRDSDTPGENQALHWSEDPTLSQIFENLIPSTNLSFLRPNQVFSPPTDVYENESHFVVKLEIAGLETNQVTIEVTNSELVVSGVRRETNVKKVSHYHQVEVHYGAFERLVRLPYPAKLNQAKASYSDGFLIIQIPKTTGSKVRNIPIEEE